jgi:outer membrane protein OmpA-like peptidoglycan-associated protein
MKPFSSALMVTVALIAGSGCASKTLVVQELDRRDARIAHNITAAQDAASAQIRRDAEVTQQRFSVVDERIGALEARTAELQDRAQGAAMRAESASPRAENTDAWLSRLWAHRNSRTVVNTLHVEFPFDQSALDDTAKSVLFVLIGELRGDPRLAVDLEGYTDSKGSRQYNVRLSQRRLDAVRRYLIEQGMERHRIKTSARGSVDNPAIPEARKRRVDVKLVVAAEGSATARGALTPP